MGREIYDIINDMAEVLNASHNKCSSDKDYNRNATKISCGIS